MTTHALSGSPSGSSESTSSDHASQASSSAEAPRRRFLVGSAAASGGLMLGFQLSVSSEAFAQAQTTTLTPVVPSAGTPEVNAWVVIKPDDSVIIRIARSEMGQGTLTGLAQLVAEELECDWSRVTTEYPTPGQNVARKRVWGNFSTGGSRGIRESQEYVRKGGDGAPDAHPGRGRSMDSVGL